MNEIHEQNKGALLPFSPEVDTARFSKETEPVEWSDERFASGVGMIDDQHKRLIDIFNRTLQTLREETSAFADVVALVKELDDYIKTHFNYEEGCMSHYGCKNDARNRKEHEEFRRELKSFIDLVYFEVPARDILASKLRFLVSWITNHIGQTDRCIGPCKAAFEEQLEERNKRLHAPGVRKS